MGQPRSSSPARVIAFALAGVVAGVGGTLLAGKLRAPPAAPPPSVGAPPPNALAPAPGGTSPGAARLRALEERLAQLEERERARERARDAGAPPAEQQAGDHRREAAEERAQFQALVDDHRRDRVDAAWSRAASAGLRGDLGSLATEGHFQVLEMDCRSSSCVATLEWPTFSEARHARAALIGHRYHPNCAYGLSLPEPDDAASAYRTSMIFQCGDAPLPSPEEPAP